MALALLLTSCSTVGVIAVAEVGMHNTAPGTIRILSVSARAIGRLDFDGASLESVPDNNPGEGERTVPVPKVPGESLAPITRSPDRTTRSRSLVPTRTSSSGSICRPAPRVGRPSRSRCVIERVDTCTRRGT